jgi:hypothetical protein
LLDFICEGDQPKAMAAGDLLFNHKTTKDKFALDLQDVFDNKKDSITQQFSKCRLKAENFKKDDKTYFQLKIDDFTH